MNPRNFTLPCTIGSLNFYAMADLGATLNVIPKSMFEQLKLDRLKKTLVEIADMTKRSPIGIVENVIVKIDKFLFLSDFVVMDMLNTRNETMILRRPFLATIHAKIDAFNKEISLGIGGDRVTFDMDKKIHNFTALIGEIYMINATSNTSSDASYRVEETNYVHNKNNSCNQKQGRSRKKPRKLEFDINLPSTHFVKSVKQILEGELKFWPTCDPNIKECNGCHEDLDGSLGRVAATERGVLFATKALISDHGLSDMLQASLYPKETQQVDGNVNKNLPDQWTLEGSEEQTEVGAAIEANACIQRLQKDVISVSTVALLHRWDEGERIGGGWEVEFKRILLVVQQF
ncbi:reverse transcriptase domain-containing protein [Tanacetum coccineum]